ncbi:MAG: hypothetical protein WC662_00395 [Candidatus Paceibacterota bacterium]|jgi:hypothetical protein
MLGDSIQSFTLRNKKERRQEAIDCLRQLRRLSREENIEEFKEILDCLLTLINDKNPINEISLTEIGTSEAEIKKFKLIQNLILEILNT